MTFAKHRGGDDKKPKRTVARMTDTELRGEIEDAKILAVSAMKRANAGDTYSRGMQEDFTKRLRGLNRERKWREDQANAGPKNPRKKGK